MKTCKTDKSQQRNSNQIRKAFRSNPINQMRCIISQSGNRRESQISTSKKEESKGGS